MARALDPPIRHFMRFILRWLAPAAVLLSTGLLGAVAGYAFGDRADALGRRVQSRLERMLATAAASDADRSAADEWKTADGTELEVHSRGFDYPVRIVFHPRAQEGGQEGVPLYYVSELP